MDDQTWSGARPLGFKPMDEVHEDFYRATQALLTCDTKSVMFAIDQFASHALAHFDQEDEWMRTTAFPPRDCHLEEHAAVLKSVREVRNAVAEGKGGLALAHRLARHLLDWFPGHADYLDAALAAWMTKLVHGGAPVVFRRKTGA